MYTRTNCTEFAHYVQSQRMTTYEARITPTQTQMRELLQIESDALTRGHLINTQLPNDPLLPLADMDKKSLNLDEALGTDSQLVCELPEQDKRSLLLRWHYRLGHLPLGMLKNLAKQGIIDS